MCSRVPVTFTVIATTTIKKIIPKVYGGVYLLIIIMALWDCYSLSILYRWGNRLGRYTTNGFRAGDCFIQDSTPSLIPFSWHIILIYLQGIAQLKGWSLLDKYCSKIIDKWEKWLICIQFIYQQYFLIIMCAKHCATGDSTPSSSPSSSCPSWAINIVLST